MIDPNTVRKVGDKLACKIIGKPDQIEFTITKIDDSDPLFPIGASANPKGSHCGWFRTNGTCMMDVMELFELED